MFDVVLVAAIDVASGVASGAAIDATTAIVVANVAAVVAAYDGAAECDASTFVVIVFVGGVAVNDITAACYR